MRAALFCLGLLALLASAPDTAVANEADRSFLTRFLEENLSGAGRNVRISGFEGALSSRATIEEMTFADDEGIWLILRGAVLDWRRTALLRGVVDVNELAAEEIIVLRQPDIGESGPSPEARGAFSLPELPVSVRIGSIRAERVTLGADLLGREAVVNLSGGMELGGGEGNAELKITRIDGEEGSLQLTGSYSNASRLLDIDLTVEEGAGGIAATLLGLPGRPSVRLQVVGSGPLDNFVADISLATADQERLSGEIVLLAEADGDAATTRRFRLDVGGDLTPLLSADLHPVVGTDSRFSAEGASFADGRLELTDLTLRTESMSLSGHAALGSDGLPEVIALNGRVAMRESGPVVIPFTEPRATLDHAELSLQFDSSVSEDWELVLVVADLRHPEISIDRLALDGIGQISTDGDGTGTDVIDAVLDFIADGLAPADPALARALGRSLEGSATIIWREGEPVRLPGFFLEGSEYRLAGQGTLEGDTFTGGVQASLSNLARYSELAGRELAGALEGSVEGRLEALTGAFDLEASLVGQDLNVGEAQIDNLLAGRSEINASLLRNQQGTQFRGLTVDASTLQLTGFGAISRDRVTAEAQMDFSDLSVLGTGYGGALGAEARFSQLRGDQQLTLTARGRDLSIGQPELDRVMAGESQVTLQAGRSDDIITLEQFRFEAQALAASAQGRIIEGASDLTGTLHLPDLGRIRPGLGGTVSADIQVLEADGRRNLILDASGENLRSGMTEIDRILAGTTRLALTGWQDGSRLRVSEAQLRNPQGSASLNAEIDENTRRLNLDAQLDTLAVILPGFDGPVRLSGRVTEASEGYQVEAQGSGPGAFSVNVSGQMQQDLTANLSITGGADLALANPRINPIVIQGPMSFDLRLRGRPAVGSLSGRATASGARIVSPNGNVTLQNVEASADLSGGRASISARGDAAAGGSFDASGSIGLGGAFPADVRVTLSALRVFNPELFDTSVSGVVNLTGEILNGAMLRGELRLGETEIRVPSSGLGSAGFVPARIRHVSEPAAVRRTRERAGVLRHQTQRQGRAAPMGLDIRLDAPNRIFVRGRGLDAELGGSLVLGGTLADVIPSGEFSLIRGRLDLLGNRFTLSEGFASLQGRFVPFIRLAATTESDGISTTVSVEGVATEPEIRFSSVPELPQDEVVSRLIFGRDLRTLSPFQAAQLASAVATLTGRGGNGVLDQVRQGFGLDDFDVTTDDSGTAAVRAGRYLTENIYTDITVDSRGRSEVSINLDVTDSLRVRGRAGTDGRTGIGVFFERDY